MKIRGYIFVAEYADENQGYIISNYPIKRDDGKSYTFIIDVPHNFQELKTVEELEEVKE